MIKLIITLGIFLTVSFNSPGQDVWSLQRCIDYAIKNNVQIKQGEVATQYQQNLLRQSKNARLPNLSGNMSQNWTEGTIRNTYQNISSVETDFGLSTNLPVFSGFQITNNIKVTSLNLQASLQDLEKAKSDITMNIASTYLAILFDKDLIKVSQDQLTITNQTINQTNAKVEAGSLAKGSLLEIQAQAAGEELNIVNAQNQLQLDKLRLTQLLEIQASDSFDVQVPVLPEIKAQATVTSSKDIFKTAVTFRPEIRSADFKVQSSQYQLKSAQGILYPSIYLYANFADLYNNKYTDPGTPGTNIPGPTTSLANQLRGNQRKACRSADEYSDFHKISK